MEILQHILKNRDVYIHIAHRKDSKGGITAVLCAYAFYAEGDYHPEPLVEFSGFDSEQNAINYAFNYLGDL